MTREEIIRLIIQCGMWSNDSGYYEGRIENIEEAMQEYAESENAVLRQKVEELHRLLDGPDGRSAAKTVIVELKNEDNEIPDIPAPPEHGS